MAKNEIMVCEDKYNALFDMYEKAVHTMNSCTFYETDYDYTPKAYWKSHEEHVNFLTKLKEK